MDEPGLSITAEQRAASARALLFDPPREAEPSVAEEREGGEDAEKPTVLSKLQKWVRPPISARPRAALAPRCNAAIDAAGHS